jgi:hypothetical protein
VQRKTEIVLRLLRGEALDAVSRESQVPAHELESTSIAGGSLPGVVVGFRALSFMPGLLDCRHRSPDGVRRNRVRFRRGYRGASGSSTHEGLWARARRHTPRVMRNPATAGEKASPEHLHTASQDVGPAPPHAWFPNPGAERRALQTGDGIVRLRRRRLPPRSLRRSPEGGA